MNQSPTPSTQATTAAGSAGRSMQWLGALLLAAGLLMSIWALSGEESRPRFAFGYLWGFTFVWCIVLGSLFFLGLHHLTHAVWSVVFRRVVEAFASPTWLVAVLFVPILAFALMPGVFALFPWTDAEHVQHDHLLHMKEPYLNVPFFAIRAILFFALWIGFSRWFVNTSLSQDEGGDATKAALAMRKWSSSLVIVFAVTVTFASIDWLMSLDPYWFSTIYGVYVFSGMILSALAVVTIVSTWLHRTGRLGPLTGDHFYSLGLLLFAFTCFWAYIAFSQYMLIWYANIPEETGYLHRRLEGDWLRVSVWLAMVRFVVPFFVLLGQGAKKNPRLLFWVSVLVLVGQMLDGYWLVMPEFYRAAPRLGWQELGPPLVACGALLLAVTRFLARHPVVAVGDPLLEQSRNFHL